MDGSSEFGDIHELLRTSTTPDVRISLRGFSSEAGAKEMGEIVGIWLRILGACLNLERLEGVTVAYDYDAALAEIDRRSSVRNPLAATRDEFAVGVAMAVPVLRDGQPRSHIVVNAGVVHSLKDESDTNHQFAISILAHEAAHVHDLLMQDRAFPGVILQRQITYRENVLLGIASRCWEEYAASRLSARFEHPKQLEGLESLLCGVLENVRTRGNQHIRDYRLHHDLMKLMEQIVGGYGRLMKYTSYLLGHIGGSQHSFAEASPKASQMIEAREYFAPTFTKLSACLENMWSSYGHWTGLEVFDPLKEIAHSFLKTGGVDIQDREGGAAYIHVPFTPETMPFG